MSVQLTTGDLYILDGTPKVKDSCELLSLTLDGGAWHVVHILSYLEALDEERSIRNMRNGKPSRTRRFKKLVLNTDEITTGGLFRVKGAGLTTYCSDVEGGFYDLVKQNNLKGLKFREVELS